MVYENPDVDVDTLAFSKKRKVLTYVTYTTSKQERKYLDPETEKMFTDIEKKLPNYLLFAVGNDHDENQFIISAMSDRTPGFRYLYDVKTGELTKLAEVAPWLKADQLAKMKPIEYKSRDGLTIHGYLTLPVGREAKNLPVVVNPHGGPWARDEWGLQFRSAASRQPRLRCPPDEFPRLDRLRPEILGSLLQAMGQNHAGRHHRWRAVVD